MVGYALRCSLVLSIALCAECALIGLHLRLSRLSSDGCVDEPISRSVCAGPFHVKNPCLQCCVAVQNSGYS